MAEALAKYACRLHPPKLHLFPESANSDARSFFLGFFFRAEHAERHVSA